MNLEKIVKDDKACLLMRCVLISVNMFYLFDLILYVQVNNLSVTPERVFLG